MSQRETKSFHGELKADGDGIVEAIVSVYGNIDSYNERVMPGAFANSLAAKLPTGVLSHDWNNPVATTLSVEELLPGDPRLPENVKGNGGLYIKGQFFEDIPSSWEAYLKIKRGLFREFSIGYNVVKDGFKDGVRELYELDLHEWSPVLVGANPATSLLAVKSASYDDRVELLETELMELVSATDARAGMRLKAGRVLSSRNVGALTSLAASLAKARKEIIRILNEASPQPKEEGKTNASDANKLAIAKHILESLEL
jgi:HK97 family phage prohead protease